MRISQVSIFFALILGCGVPRHTIITVVTLIPAVVFSTGLWTHNLILPRIAVCPGKVQRCDCGCVHLLQGGQSLLHDGHLIVRVVGFAGGMPQGVVEINGPGRVHRLGNGISTGKTQGRDTPGFNFPGDQSNGLVADGSHRHQENQIHLVINHSVG